MELQLTKPICFFDLETTGINIATDRIVEISILKIFPNGNKQSHTWRVNPTVPIPPETTAVHGITDQMVVNEPVFKDLSKQVYDLIKDRRSDAEIRVYMQERYGDFISYKPPMRPSTWILWFFPPLLLLVLIIGWFWQSKRRQVVARGQSGVTVNSTAALTSTEKAELDRLLSQAENVDHDITSIEDKK